MALARAYISRYSRCVEVSDAVADTPVGRTLNGRYDVAAPISSGAMGAVYRATDRQDGVDVAVKQLMDVRHAARFEIEARLLAQLRHPRVVRVIDYFQVEDGQYLVMNLVEGEDLGGLLKAPAPAGYRSSSRSSGSARPARRSSTCTTSRSCTAT